MEQDRRRYPQTLTPEEVRALVTQILEEKGDEIAKEAAQKARESFYADVGKSLLSRGLVAVATACIALAYWFSNVPSGGHK